jgi:hypothetical protein
MRHTPLSRKSAKLSRILSATMLLPAAHAGLIFQSATLGSQQFPGGTVQNTPQLDQALGVHFLLTSTVQVTEIETELWGPTSPPNQLYAEIYALSGPTAFPSGDPFDTAPLARAFFTAPSTLQDVFVPLSVTLAPGSYALVFGSVPSSGTAYEGLIPETGTDLAGITSQSYLAYESGQLSATPGGSWENGAIDKTPFVVEGNVVPEPATISIGIFGLILVFAWRGFQRRAAS